MLVNVLIGTLKLIVLSVSENQVTAIKLGKQKKIITLHYKYDEKKIIFIHLVKF